MIFWHLGLTLFLFIWIFRDKNADLRYLLVGSLLPDIIDKTLYLFLLTNNSRTYGHTLLFAVFSLFAIMILTSRDNPKRKSYLLIPIALLFHLVLDEMWMFSETLFWPSFNGKFSALNSSADSLIELFIISINKTEVIVKEIIGMSFFFISINQNMSFRANLVDLIKTGKY